MEEKKWKEELMDKFCVTFERAQDDSVVERLEDFIQSEIDLVVSKERSRIVEKIDTLGNDIANARIFASHPNQAQQTLSDVIDLINTK